jgi:hypothetical protein
LNKNDIEFILERSIEFWKDKLKERINLVDIYALASEIWTEIQYDTNWENEIKEYILRKSELTMLEEHGDLILEEEDGTYVYLTFIDDSELTSITESGKIYVWGEEAEDDN